MKNKIYIALIIPLFAIAVALGFVAVKKTKVLSGEDYSALPARYVDSPSSFAGNKYSISAQIDSQLAYKEGVGRILLVKIFPSGDSLPLFISVDVENFNPQRGQRYAFDVDVKPDGKLSAYNFKKM